MLYTHLVIHFSVLILVEFLCTFCSLNHEFCLFRCDSGFILDFITSRTHYGLVYFKELFLHFSEVYSVRVYCECSFCDVFSAICSANSSESDISKIILVERKVFSEWVQNSFNFENELPVKWVLIFLHSGLKFVMKPVFHVV